MSQPSVVDAFKFVAVRPAQLVSKRESAIGLMSDARLGDDGDLDRSVADDDRWSGVADKPLSGATRLQSMAELSRGLADHFAAQPGSAPSKIPSHLEPDHKVGDEPELAGKSWDLIYAAYQRGPKAGPSLETPIAALRLMHFMAFHRDGIVDTAENAVIALSAIALIPPELAGAATAEAAEVGTRRGSARVADGSEGSSGPVHSLVEEISATRSLLDAVRSVNLKTKALIEPAPSVASDGDSTKKLIRVNRTASLAPLLATDLPMAVRSVATDLHIGESTSIPTATSALQHHLAKLLHRADTLRGDPATHRTLIKLAHQLDAPDLVGILPDVDKIDLDWPEAPGTAFDYDLSGMIRPLGVGDLKVVKQTLLAYQPGEVAHIENVLKGEHKERVHRTLDRTETSIFEATEENTEMERDTQSTDRYELKQEAEKTIKEDMSVEAGVTVTAAFGPVVTTAHGDFAYSTSKQGSERSSSNFAREVVERSVSKIQTKVKVERTTKTFHETEETNSHGVNNEDGTEHSVGVYRWVDKRYRGQVYNYGRRLMLEFIVPQPAAFWLASQLRKPPTVDAKPPESFVNAVGKPLGASDIDENNYRIYASRWNAAGVTPPPLEWTYASTVAEQSGVDNSKTVSKALKDLVVPDGYTLIYYIAEVALVWATAPRFTISIGDDTHTLVADGKFKGGFATDMGWEPSTEEWDNPKGVVPVSLVGYDINAYSVNIGINCKRNQTHFEDWQLRTFEKISAGYQAMKTTYDQLVAQADAQSMGIEIQGRNPAQNREIERNELKKLCIMMMTGSHLGDFDAVTDPADAPKSHPEVKLLEAMREGPVVQFFEQAFDWQQMTYLFYPYFWGRKKHWVEAVNRSDADPLFANFRQAGAARVVVPVSPAYNEAVSYFLSKRSPNFADRIWLGGEPPTINDPLYKSIAAEMRAQTDDLAGAVPEDTPWEFTVPTTLVWLQQGSELPEFLA